MEFSTGDLVYYDYCTNFTGQACVEWTHHFPQSTFPVDVILVKGLFFGFIMSLSVLIMIYIFRFLFVKILGLGKRY